MPFTPVPDGYYKTKEWKAKRWKRLVHDNFTCQRCGAKYAEKQHWKLNVNHTKEGYEHIPNERLGDLFTLCGSYSGNSCHPKGSYGHAQLRADKKTDRWRRILTWLALAPFRLAWWLLQRIWRLVSWAPDRVD